MKMPWEKRLQHLQYIQINDQKMTLNNLKEQMEMNILYFGDGM
jgi:hypothetical protein